MRVKNNREDEKTRINNNKNRDSNVDSETTREKRRYLYQRGGLCVSIPFINYFPGLSQPSLSPVILLTLSRQFLFAVTDATFYSSPPPQPLPRFCQSPKILSIPMIFVKKKSQSLVGSRSMTRSASRTQPSANDLRDETYEQQ